MVHAQAALSHHLFEVAVGKLVPAILPHAQQDDRGLEVAPLEQGLMLLHEDDPWRVMAELEGGL
jgi:hypothetical protein